MKFLILAIVFCINSFCNSAFAQTTCVLDNGKARGYIYSDSALDYSGRPVIMFFDVRGELLDVEEFSYISGYLSSEDSELIVETNSPKGARMCNFYLKEGETGLPTPPIHIIPTGISYKSQCSVRNGEMWFSYLENKGMEVQIESISVDFLNSTGSKISSKKISNSFCLAQSQNINLDKATEVPSEAVKCELKIESSSFAGCQ